MFFFLDLSRTSTYGYKVAFNGDATGCSPLRSFHDEIVMTFESEAEA